ncbi:uncharacterized protein [Littorina saxatilis]|uniref:uncharacterized protein isoform X2 n=1 Tax=Littorina saxatilis TaxID=31220 RepID=UPI0038B6AADA
MDRRLPFYVVVLVLCTNSVTASRVVSSNTTHSTHDNITKGDSGVSCTKIGRRCLTGIDCVDKECVCPPGQKGNGEIECVDNENFLCTVSADPHLHSYGLSRTDVDLPCRYRLTRYLTEHRTAATSESRCTVEVYVTNELNMGQYYVRSVSISLSAQDSGEQVHHEFEVRKFGVSEDQIFNYQSNVTRTQSVWGSATHETVNGVDVYPTFDEENNFAVLWVPECATRIKYRAYDRSQHRQHQLPGISIMAPPDSKFLPTFGNYPHSLCGTFTDNETLYADRATGLGLFNKDLGVIYDILTEKASQNDNPARQNCETAMDTFETSADKTRDLNACGDILIRRKVRKCTVDDKGVQPIEAFISCLKYKQSTASTSDCSLLVALINDCDKQWRGPPVVCP